MKIILGITGSIAAYRSLDLIRRFEQGGHTVKAVLSSNAAQFITPLSAATFAKGGLYCERFPAGIPQPVHIAIASWGDVLIIAPATLDIIGQMANGISGDLLTDIYFAFKGPVLVAPAMNTNMYEHPALQENLEKLKRMNVIQIPPRTAALASYRKGRGAMENIEVIETETLNAHEYGNELAGKTVLITAGGTKERIDPVRYISNSSSGETAGQIALSFYRKGALVKMITSAALNLPCGIEIIKASSSAEFLSAVKEHIHGCDIFVSAAAIADFIPAYNPKKIKKDSFGGSLELKKGPDILEWVSGRKKRPFIVGFAAETELNINALKRKFSNKPVDILFANLISERSGFGDLPVKGFISYGKRTVHLEGITKEKAAKILVGLIIKKK